MTLGDVSRFTPEATRHTHAEGNSGMRRVSGSEAAQRLAEHEFRLGPRRARGLASGGLDEKPIRPARILVGARASTDRVRKNLKRALTSFGSPTL
jgi:hypothetical protein